MFYALLPASIKSHVDAGQLPHVKNRAQNVGYDPAAFRGVATRDPLGVSA